MMNHVLNKETKPKSKRKIMILELQKICGFLNFLGRAVVPGRAFTRRPYAHLTNNQNPKQHHHICVMQVILDDLKMWRDFIKHPSIFCRPFLDMSKTWNAEELAFFVDLSCNLDLGFGTYCQRSWMQGCWDPSIQYLELYALAAGVMAWIHRFKNMRIIIFCDNQSMVNMVNNSSSKCCNCMILIRIIVLKCMVHNVKLFARFIPTKQNEMADSLS